MANRITFEKIYDTIDDYFAICLNGKRITNADAMVSTASSRVKLNLGNNINILWVYLYIDDYNFVDAEIPYRNGEIEKALKVAKMYVKQALAATTELR